jgi:aryl-alcohol dehydrogenase-like predicted oxidoreductase
MGDNFKRNLELVPVIEEIARRKDATPAQLALAWVMAQGENIVPIPGTRRRTRLDENLGGAGVDLTPQDLEEIAGALPRAVGDRYSEVGMRALNG